MRLQSWIAVLCLVGSSAGCAKEVPAPIAMAGADLSVNTGTSAQLDGSTSSDKRDRPLRYEWRFVALPDGSNAAFNDASLARPSFTPDVAGEYIAGLRVSNGAKYSAEDTVTVMVGSGAPTAAISPAASVNEGGTVSLSAASSTDPDGHLLYFQWKFSGIPAGSAATLVAADTAAPSFVPDRSGDYAIELVVHDGIYGNVSAPQTLVVTVGDGSPTAMIGPSSAISVTAGTLVQLDGAGSSDPDNHLLSYSWAFVSRPVGSTASFNDASSANPTFMPDAPGDYVLRLMVDDGSFGNASAPVTKTVSVTGTCAPVANAGADSLADQLDAVQLDGSASSSPCSRPLSYAWAFTSMPDGSQAVLNDGALAAPAFIADVAGTYTLSLVTTDDQGKSSAADTVLITAGTCVPTANPTTPITGKLQGDLVQLVAGAATEPCAMPVNGWRWIISSRPVGSLATLSSGTDKDPTFVADLAGDYVFKLEVTNSEGLTSAAATVSVPSVGSCVPTASFTADSAFTVDGEEVRLSSTSTSPCARPLSHSWQIVSAPAGSTATLSAPADANSAFLADRPGDYVVRLQVADALGIADPDGATATADADRRRVDVSNTGAYVSLALRGAAEQPVVGYYDATDGDLKYAEYDGANWAPEAVDLGGDVGQYASVALTPDVDALPRIAYWDVSNDNLKYAEKNAAGAWGSVTVDAADLEDGRYASLALDSTGKPRIVYQARIVGTTSGTRRVLKYAFCEADCLVATNWTKKIIVNSGADGAHVGQAAQLALSAGVPQFSYYHITSGDLFYGVCSDAPCTTVTVRAVDTAGDVGSEAGLALDGTGHPRIAYYDGSNGNAKFASCEEADCSAAGAAWSLRTLETTGDTGRQPSLAVDASTGACTVAWQDRTRQVGRIAIGMPAGAFSIDDGIADAGDSDRGLSVRRSAAGNVRAAYYGAGSTRASLFRRGN